MKIASKTTLVSAGTFPASKEWAGALKTIETALRGVSWPVDTAKFTINPAKKQNGVTLIKASFVSHLTKAGWKTEKPIALASGLKPGNLDLMLATSVGPIAIEWETGNVSSCHRSMNKLALGLIEGAITAGVMIVPTRALAKFLTDRIANLTELEPYFPFWGAIQCKNGVLLVIAFEHDETDPKVALIPKGKDGNAKKQILASTGLEVEDEGEVARDEAEIQDGNEGVDS